MTLEETIINNKGLIWKVARRFQKIGEVRGLDIDDLYQEASLGFMKAYETFDENKGQFSTYATKVMYNKLKFVLTINNPVKFSRQSAEFAVKIGQSNLENPTVEDVMKLIGCQREAAYLALQCHLHTITDSINHETEMYGEKTQMVELHYGEYEDFSQIIVDDFFELLTPKEKIVARGLFDGYKQADVMREILKTKSGVSRNVRNIQRRWNLYNQEGQSI